MPLMVRVKKVPELMADAMRFTKSSDEEIPIFLSEQIKQERGLKSHTLKKTVEQPLVTRALSTVQIARTDRVVAVAREQLIEQLRRVAANLEGPIVQSPLKQLNSIEVGSRHRLDRIDDRHSASYPTGERPVVVLGVDFFGKHRTHPCLTGVELARMII